MVVQYSQFGSSQAAIYKAKAMISLLLYTYQAVSCTASVKECTISAVKGTFQKQFLAVKCTIEAKVLYQQ
jgi:hypothetical protein